MVTRQLGKILRSFIHFLLNNGFLYKCKINYFHCSPFVSCGRLDRDEHELDLDRYSFFQWSCGSESDLQEPAEAGLDGQRGNPGTQSSDPTNQDAIKAQKSA